MLISPLSGFSFAKQLHSTSKATYVSRANSIRLLLLLVFGMFCFSSVFSQAVSGSYTVNPALASGGTNFKRIGEVDTFLMTRGINGPVDIKIYNGTYNQPNMVLNTVSGLRSMAAIVNE